MFGIFKKKGKAEEAHDDTPPQFTGALLDMRSEAEKMKDYKHDEISDVGVSNVIWKKRDPLNPRDCKFFSTRNQAQSSSCMAQSGAKTLGVENMNEVGDYFEPSAMQPYRVRTNFPSGGMGQNDCLNIFSKPNACSEKSLPSQGMSEEEMNTKKFTFTDAMKKEAEIFRANGYVTFDIKLSAQGKVTKSVDIDEVAKILNGGKAVQLMLYFLSGEYWKTNPEIIDNELGAFEERTSRHGVSAVDFFVDDQGKKYLLIEDSAGNSSSLHRKGQRVLSEQFLRTRCFGAGYFIEKSNDEDATPAKPHHIFVKTLRYGMVDEEVQDLQKVLVYEGFMPSEVNGQPFVPTKNFLGMTHSAVLKWQTKHNLVSDGIVGMNSRKVLNDIYGN